MHSATTQIAIVGLLPKQERIVSERCKHLRAVQLQFLPAARKPSFPLNVDQVVLNVKFISHKWQTAAVQHVGRNNVKRNFGGLSYLIGILKSLNN